MSDYCEDIDRLREPENPNVCDRRKITERALARGEQGADPCRTDRLWVYALSASGVWWRKNGSALCLPIQMLRLAKLF
jgi:hypothetical protein